ncbi:MAG TPA: caspase family protein [Thermoanaerobaculia bacterium]|nr:caspase family protein [Thermoanaerobaculia bacterium]
MTLAPVSDELGVFADPAWKGDRPATFAVIIGASRYPHLDGTAKTYLLEQLTVSALTAYRVFDWLRAQYRYSPAPLAKCWVLLAPTGEELQYAKAQDPGFADVLKHAARPTFDACRDATRAWFRTMLDLPKAVARDSRSVFYFSGHGLEITLDRQILLPSDYLRSGFLNDSLSVPNIRNGCGVLEVRDQFFFLDACRNDHESLRAKNIRGAVILDEPEPKEMNPDRNSALVYASAAGTRAFSPLHPSEGLSIFGHALVEGLTGTPDVELKCDDRECAIHLYSLHRFIKRRVPALLKARGATVQQRIPLDGPFIDEPVVTRIDRPVRSTGPSGPPARTTGDPLDPLPDTLDLGPGQIVGISHAELFRRDVVKQLHRTFGSETVTDAWKNARVYSLADRRWQTSHALTFHTLQRHGRDVYRARVSIRGRQWLQVAIENGSPAQSAFAAVLPDLDNNGDAMWDIDIYRDEPGVFTIVDVNLSPYSKRDLPIAAMLWRMYAEESAAEAMSSRLRSTLETTLTSPLAALVLILVALRAYAKVPVEAWYTVSEVTTVSDPSVLEVEYARRTGRSPERSREILIRLMAVLERVGLPVLSESFGYLDRFIGDVLSSNDAHPWMESDLWQRVRAIEKQLATAMRFFRPGGFAGTFIARNPTALSPELILPAGFDFTTPPITTTPEAQGGLMANA